MVAILALLPWAQACPGEEAACEEKVPLVDVDAWVLVEPDADAVWPAPEGTPLCAVDAVQVQQFGGERALEIDTSVTCGWATVEQPLLASVATGESLQVRVFYFSQTSFPAATAEVGLAVGGEVAMAELVDIPAASGLIAPRLRVQNDAAAGTPIAFHVGNHGANSWNLLEVSLLRSIPCP